MEEFKFDMPIYKIDTPPNNGDIRSVQLDVKVIFEWSDKIVADYDSETDTILEYKSGYVMKVLPNQSFVYKGEPSLLLANSLLEKV